MKFNICAEKYKSYGKTEKNRIYYSHKNHPKNTNKM